MALPASIIVNVTTDVPPVIDTSTGQNSALFLTDVSAALPVTERVRPYYDAASVGTDLGPTTAAYHAAVSYFAQNPHPPTLYIGVRDTVATETVEAALAACLAKFQFYGVVIDHVYTDADAEDAAAFIETQIMLYGRASSDPLIIDPASSVDFASKMKDTFTRTFVFAREAALTDYPEMAVIARTIAVDLTVPGSANTIGVQALAGIAPSTFTQAQFNAAVAKNCNIYEQIGPAPVVFPGIMAGGLFIEDQYGVDFLQAYITQLAINAIETSKRVPQTDPGMNYIKGYLDTGLAQVVASGFLAAGYWSGETFTGIVSNGELLAKGYKIVAQPISTLTPPQRAQGYGSNIAIALKGSGAIHQLNIFMPFNP